MPSGRGEVHDKKKKRKSKEQLEKELRKKSLSQPIQPTMTFEVIKPKRRQRDEL